MSDAPAPAAPISPAESKAEAQTPGREAAAGGVPPGGVPSVGASPAADTSGDDLFVISRRVSFPADARPHARRRDEPLYRRLRVYTLDPSTSRLDGAIAALNVPYEPLGPGPSGALFEVVDYDDTRQRHYSAVDLEQPFVLMQDGRRPSPADPHFHQQMVYAVASRVYFTFKLALGRDLSWAFESPRLRLRPHAFVGQNAYYSRSERELAFGYFRNDPNVGGRNLPGGTTFTCLSHDVVAHETTHALLDGLRASFTIATGPDVLAFHEALADLIAVFLHFQYPEVVKAAIKGCRGNLRQPSMLSDLAQQFGQTTGAGRALRYAIEELAPGAPAAGYDRTKHSHELGGVLVAAVYDAFVTVFERKVARALRLATNGSGLIREGELDLHLLDELAETARKLATNFLNICIRALDYCPSVDVQFGEYLRAVITADADLVPDDPWAYREALIDAFRRRRIFPSDVPNLSEESLRWESTATGLSIPALHFRRLRFAGDPATAASRHELRRQARAVGRMLVKDDAARAAFGLAPSDASGVDKPRVESIRSLRRVGPDSQVVFDLVAEITQSRMVPLSAGGPLIPFLGGATIIIGPEGNVRHAIYKRVMNERRLEEQREFVGGVGNQFWDELNGTLSPKSTPFRLLHDRR
jgi:hypothetical protein